MPCTDVCACRFKIDSLSCILYNAFNAEKHCFEALSPETSINFFYFSLKL